MEITLENCFDWRYPRSEEAQDIGVFLRTAMFGRLATRAVAICRCAALIGVCCLWKAAGLTGTIEEQPISFPTTFSSTLQVEHEYQNEYQIDSNRFVPIGADTGRLLSKNQENTPKAGLRRPIPTSASISQVSMP